MSIALIGDVAFNGLLSEQPELNTQRLEKVQKVLSEIDIVIANLEVPVMAGDEINDKKSTIHSATRKATEQAVNLLNLSCVSLANNHIYDFKMGGLKATIDLLEKQKVKYTGAGWKDYHLSRNILNHNENKIAFLAFVDQATNPHTESFDELRINYFELEIIIETITSLRKIVDYIIISIHWGVDYSHYPTKYQVKWAHKLIDAGANIIMGHHPHTIQPFEHYNGGLIFYSLGGLIFGDFYKNGTLMALPRKTKRGVIPIFDNDLNLIKVIGTKDKKGNFLTIIDFDYNLWSSHKWRVYRLMNKYKMIKNLVYFKESVVDRSFDYFFGYYNNFFVRLMQLGNLKKIKKLFVDYQTKKNRKS